MSETSVTLRFLEPTGSETGEALVLGHSLGTSAALWNEALPGLQEGFRVIRWELPGHGEARPARGPYRMQDVTDALVGALDRRGVERFHYAGVSISGCVGLDLGLRYPERLATVAVISAGARVDDPPLMRERAAIAREQGVGTFVEPFRERWFAPTTSSVTTERLLGILERTDALSYGYAAEALADFDVWDLLFHIDTPLLAVGGQQDRSVPVERSFELATKVPRGIAISIPNAAHTVVAEGPDAVSQALGEFIERNRSRSRP